MLTAQQCATNLACSTNWYCTEESRRTALTDHVLSAPLTPPSSLLSLLSLPQCSLNASHNPQIRSAAQKTLANLQPPASHASSLLSAYDSQTAPSERRSTAGVGAGGGAGASSTRSSSSSSHSASRPRPITIKIEGIAEEFWRKLVEDSLIKVSGVISVTLDTVSWRLPPYGATSSNMQPK